jgi:HlyD family secretion protein
MKNIFSNTRVLALITGIILLLATFFYVSTRSGPLAPIKVTVNTVKNQSISPALFGIGTVQARYVHHIGPTTPGRVLGVTVEVGDVVKAGQMITEMDPVDLDDRIQGQDSGLKRAQSLIVGAEAQLREVTARAAFAAEQDARYIKLLASHSVSQEAADVKHQENTIAVETLAAARAGLDGAQHDLSRITAERAALVKQRDNLRLLSPIDGLVVSRAAEPGNTVVAGQEIVQIIDPSALWIDVRFDQSRATGLAPELSAEIVLRSQQSRQTLAGKVLRIEPLADAVTEEILAKVVFDALPVLLPPLGEMAEVTVALPPLPALPAIPNGALKRSKNKDNQTGVWLVRDKKPIFAPVRVGASDLDGRVQISEGLQEGDQIIVYSQREISEGSRIKIIDQLVPGTPQKSPDPSQQAKP